MTQVLKCLLLLVVLLSIQSTKSSASEVLWEDVCTQQTTKDLPFCDETLDLQGRVMDYVNRIPTENQILMMGNNASGYDTLSIPPYQWWSEGLHGALEPCVQYENKCSCPTSFPSPSVMGNAFNQTLYELVGHVIGIEGHAISNLRQHKNDIGDGLTYWSPTINMQRDPRWGRNQEVPGEDPHLTKVYAKAFVNGLQGGDHEKIRVGACCKHYVANSLEHWYNYSRHNFDAHISDEDLHDYYFPPFEECSKTAVGVMCSYNAVNGQPACANPWLLNDVLREKWNFSGYLVTDCGALGDVVYGHHYAVDGTQAAAMAKNASVDVNCGNGEYFPNGLLRAYKEKWVEESTIRQSFQRMATIQFRLGLFDASKKEQSNPVHDIESIGSPHHKQLALEAALQGIVLLQNKNNLLPLDPTLKKKIAIIGPHLNATSALLSNYHGAACGCSSDGSIKRDDSCIETPFQAIARTVKFPRRHTISERM